MDNLPIKLNKNIKDQSPKHKEYVPKKLVIGLENMLVKFAYHHAYSAKNRGCFCTLWDRQSAHSKY